MRAASWLSRFLVGGMVALAALFGFCGDAVRPHVDISARAGEAHVDGRGACVERLATQGVEEMRELRRASASARWPAACGAFAVHGFDAAPALASATHPRPGPAPFDRHLQVRTIVLRS